MNEFSILIPVYNSSAQIPLSIAILVDFFQKKSAAFKIFLCDDRSSDSSWKSLEISAQRYSQVRILRNENNQGLGAVLRRLIRAADTEAVVYCDVDLPFGPEGIECVLDALSGSDVAVASRYYGCANKVSPARKIFSRIYCCFCRSLFGIRVMDVGSGTVAFKKSLAEKLDLQSNRFAVHAEFYAKVAQQGFRIKEIGLPSEERSGSFSIIKHGPQVLWDTARLYFTMVR